MNLKEFALFFTQHNPKRNLFQIVHYAIFGSYLD